MSCVVLDKIFLQYHSVSCIWRVVSLITQRLILYMCGFSRWLSRWRTHLPRQETQETRVWFLSQEDTSEEEMATHSSILAWKIPWTEEPGRLYSPVGCKESDTTEWLSMHIYIYIYAYLNRKLYIYIYERETLELHFSLIGKKKWKDLEAHQDTGAIFTTRKFLGNVSLSF